MLANLTLDTERKEPPPHDIMLARERNNMYHRKLRTNTEYKVREAKRNLERIRKYRADLLAILGYKCATCGFADNRVLQIDHIKSGGKKETIVHGGTAGMYINYLKDAEKAKNSLQTLCANCNWIKRAELQEFRRREN